MRKENERESFFAGGQEIQTAFAGLCPIVDDVLMLEGRELRPDDRLTDDLGADSLDVLIIAGKAEKAFDVRIDIHRGGWDKNGTLRDICADIVRLRKETGLL